MESKAELLILGILKQFVNHGDDLAIVRTSDDQGVHLTLTSNPLDAGLIIGRQGDTLNSIRQLARLVGARDKETIWIHFKDAKGNYKR